MLNTTAFIAYLAEDLKISKAQAKRFMGSFFTGVQKGLQSTNTVAFKGFGKFYTVKRAERNGVNPRNPSQKIVIKASTGVSFKSGRGLKTSVN